MVSRVAFLIWPAVHDVGPFQIHSMRNYFVVLLEHEQHLNRKSYRNSCNRLHLFLFQRFLRILRTVSGHCTEDDLQSRTVWRCYLWNDLRSVGLRSVVCGHHHNNNCHDPRKHVWHDVLLVDCTQCRFPRQPRHDGWNSGRVLLTHRTGVCSLNSPNENPESRRCLRSYGNLGELSVHDCVLILLCLMYRIQT